MRAPADLDAAGGNAREPADRCVDLMRILLLWRRPHNRSACL
jgi:hypothetical protein